MNKKYRLQTGDYGYFWWDESIHGRFEGSKDLYDKKLIKKYYTRIIEITNNKISLSILYQPYFFMEINALNGGGYDKNK